MNKLQRKLIKATQVLNELNELQYQKYLNSYRKVEGGVGYWIEKFPDTDTGKWVDVERKEYILDKTEFKINVVEQLTNYNSINFIGDK